LALALVLREQPTRKSALLIRAATKFIIFSPEFDLRQSLAAR
jgi:hypothetical protein